MKKIIIFITLCMCFVNFSFAADYPSLTTNIAELNTNDTVGTMYTGGSITDMNDGTVTTMTGSSSITTMHDGLVSNMTSASKIETMDGGEVGTMALNSVITEMNGGKVGTVTQWSSIKDVYDGEIAEVKDNASVERLHGGEIIDMNGNASMWNLQGGTVHNLNDNASIGGLDSGTVKNANGGIIYYMGDGTIENLNGTNVKNIGGSNAVIEIMNTGALVDEMNNGKVLDMQDGTIATMNNGEVTEMNGGTIATMNKGVVADMKDGTINLMNGSEAIVNEMHGGTVVQMENKSVISKLYGGDVTDVNYGEIYNVYGGTIQNVNGNSKVSHMEGTGKIVNLNDNAILTGMSSGNAIVENLNDNAHIGNMWGGVVENMKGGSIGKMEWSSTVENFTAGTIGELDNGARIYTTTNTSTGHIGTIKNGSIGFLGGNSTIDNVFDGALIEGMGDSAYIETVNGNADIQNIWGGTINNFISGRVENVGEWGKINVIHNIVFSGQVDNSYDSAAFDVAIGGEVILNDGGQGKTFDRMINTGADATIIAGSYTYGANSGANLGNNSSLYLNDVNFNKVNYLGGGTLVLGHNPLPGVHSAATIADFAAAGEVNFHFDVDFERNGAGNDSLIINSHSGSHTDHLITVSALSDDVLAHRYQVDLLEDQSGSLSFGLATGDKVGIGSRNYYLDSVLSGGSNQWSLFILPMLSDAAKAIGSMPTANLVSVYSLQNTLHKRMGDIRNYSEQGVWFRAFTNQTQFDTLTKTKVRNYGSEIGYDRQVAEFDDSKLSLGIAGGVNYADIKFNSANSQEGGGKTTMPYAGLYATWVTSNGFYFDAIARYIYNDTDGHYYDGANAKQNFDLKGSIANFTVEAGREYQVSNRVILEPRAELAYTYMQGDDFSDASGFKVKYGNTQSLLGTVGMIARYDIGSFSPYAKASFIYEFDGETDIDYDLDSYTSSLHGGRGEGALGFNWNMTPSWDLFAEAGYQRGAKKYTNYNGNIGVRYTFGPGGKIEPVAQQPAGQPSTSSELVSKQPVILEEATVDAFVDEGNYLLSYDSITKFDFNSIYVSPEFRKKLYKAAAEIKKNKYTTIVIIGHTDNIGTYEQNKKVSMMRAEAIAAELEVAGLEKANMELYGEAYDYPIATNTTSTGRAENRRVDIKVK